jgi:hypothetical protein
MAQNVKTDLFFLLFTITYNEERKKPVNYNKNKLNKKYKIIFKRNNKNTNYLPFIDLGQK